MGYKIGRAMVCLVLSGVLIALSGAAWAFPTDADGVFLISQPINSCSGFPIVIGQAGSYKLKTNLTVTCGHDAIDVFPHAGPPIILVTIDLNGFSITGPGPAFGGSAKGINVINGVSVVVKNGGIVAMPGDGIFSFDCRVEHVLALVNGGDGVDCFDGVIQEDTLALNFGDGASLVDGVVQNNKLVINLGDGVSAEDAVVENNKAVGNQGDGIDLRLGTVEGNTASENNANGISVESATVTGNTVEENENAGIIASGDGNKIGENTVVDNDAIGIDATGGFGDNMFANSVADNDGIGIDCQSGAKSAISWNVLYDNDGSSTDNCGAATQVNNCFSTTTNVCNGSLG